MKSRRERTLLQRNAMITRRKEPRFNGLLNHGGTCYLNTLLQTLFLTPDFRNMIYEWYRNSDVSGNDKNNITYQLKNLFRDLEENKGPVDPMRVIKCLGITNTRKQEDIAAFFRLLMKNVSDTPGLGQNIQQLFESEQVCIIKCNKCSSEDKKTTRLLQIPVPVQLTDSKHFSSVAETLQTFHTERLCDENQIYCDMCEEKCDAEMQCYLESLPKVLVLQLKRFCFDWQRYSYVKDAAPILITEKLGFERGEKGWHVKLQKGEKGWHVKLQKHFQIFWYCILLLLHHGRSCMLFIRIMWFIWLIHDKAYSELDDPTCLSKSSQDKAYSEPDDPAHLSKSTQGKAYSEPDDPTCLSKSTQGKAYSEPDDPTRLSKSTQDKAYSGPDDPAHLSKSTQNTVKYELFAICHHSGGCQGGHYWAEIKLFDDDQWYIFDDSCVQKMGSNVDNKDGSSSTAYLLMYLKIDPNKGREYLRHEILSKYKTSKRKCCEDDQSNTDKKRKMMWNHRANKGKSDPFADKENGETQSTMGVPENDKQSITCNRDNSNCGLSENQNSDSITASYVLKLRAQEGIQCNGQKNVGEQRPHWETQEKTAEVCEISSTKEEPDHSATGENGETESNTGMTENDKKSIECNKEEGIQCSKQQNDIEQSPYQDNQEKAPEEESDHSATGENGETESNTGMTENDKNSIECNKEEGIQCNKQQNDNEQSPYQDNQEKTPEEESDHSATGENGETESNTGMTENDKKSIECNKEEGIQCSKQQNDNEQSPYQDNQEKTPEGQHSQTSNEIKCASESEGSTCRAVYTTCKQAQDELISKHPAGPASSPYIPSSPPFYQFYLTNMQQYRQQSSCPGRQSKDYTKEKSTLPSSNSSDQKLLHMGPQYQTTETRPSAGVSNNNSV